MMGHNIHFKALIWKIIPKLSPLPLLIWSTGKAPFILMLPSNSIILVPETDNYNQLSDGIAVFHYHTHSVFCSCQF